MERDADDARVDAALSVEILEGESELLTTLLQEGVSEEAAAARPLAAPTPADVDVSRRVVGQWRAFVAERKGVLLLRLFKELPDLFTERMRSSGWSPSTAPC